MASRLKRLQNRKAALVTAMRKLSDTAEADEQRAMTDEETTAYEAHKGELAEVGVELAREEELQEAERGFEPVRDANELPPGAQQAVTGSRIGNAVPAWETDPKCGFKGHREFLMSVMDTATRGRIDDQRLHPLVMPSETAGSDEQSTFADPYGGFLIPPGFSPNLMKIAAEADPMAGRTTSVPMESPIIKIMARTDKNHTSSVSGGLRVYRRAESDTPAASRMEMEQVTLNAHSLFGVAYATEELLARSPISFIAVLEAGFGDEFTSTLIDERLNGSGVGEYEGILTSPCTVSEAKETGQDADTIVFENVVKMRARCWRYSQAIWLANHDTLPELMLLTQKIGTGGAAVWQPSAREGEPDMLLGRPIYFTEYCKTVGTVGDLVCSNWSQYLEGHLSPLQSANSIHVRFLTHERTFKFWMENDGRCWWRSALTPKNSTTTLSPFVTLASRD